MEIILRAVAVYAFLLVLFRLSGKRTMSEMSSFDFILLLIISEAIQNALLDEDKSVVTGMTVILTFVLMDIGLSLIKRRSSYIEKITEGVPVILVDHGEPLEEHLAKTNVTITDIMQTARQSQGLERMAQIKYAVLENSGGISIIPMEPNIEEMLDRRIEAALDRRGQGKGA